MKGWAVYAVRFDCCIFMLLPDLLADCYLLTPYSAAGDLVQVGGRVVFLLLFTVTSPNWYRGCASNCIRGICIFLCLYICSHSLRIMA